MPLLRAEYASHILNVVRNFVLANPDQADRFYSECGAYSFLGISERDSVHALLTLAWPEDTPHARKHRLHNAGVSNAVDVPDTPEPLV